MDVGSVGMPMDQQWDAPGLHDALHRLGIHIHNLLILGGRLGLTLLAGILGKGQALFEALRQELLLPLRITDLLTEFLVRVIIGAQRIAVGDQGPATIQVDGLVFPKHLHATLAGILRAEQEVSIAVEEVDRDTGLRQLTESVRDGSAQRSDMIIADPCFEQITQNVQGVRISGSLVQKIEEKPRDLRPFLVEMEVGDKEGGQRSGDQPSVAVSVTSSTAAGASGGSSITLALRMTMGCMGTSRGNGPDAPVWTRRIASTTSIPLMTSPNTV